MSILKTLITVNSELQRADNSLVSASLLLHLCSLAELKEKKKAQGSEG